MRIMVTNDDGIDGVGLHVLARAMCTLVGDHEVVVIAPDREFSGAGASLGALHLIHPEVHRGRIDDCPAAAIWTVSGPPALCVLFARLGAFGGDFDLVVSGINPGANVGRAIYHSGTVGAALTARNGHISGVAVSQSVTGMGAEGQGWDESIAGQHWDSAAAVCASVVQALLDDMPADPVVVNLNVPNVPLDEIEHWRPAGVGWLPPRTVARATLEPIPGHEDSFRVEMNWGGEVEADPSTDAGMIEQGVVAVTYLSRLVHEERPDMKRVEDALDRLIP